MSAIREVKFLRELKHPNVIEVRSPVQAQPELMRCQSCLTSSRTRRI